MPFLKLETTVVLSDERRKALLGSLSKALATTIGKPEQYVMISISQSAMLMSGRAGDAAFLDIRSIGGLTDEVNRRLSRQICNLLNEVLAIPPDRVYLNFANVPAGSWGWNGNTFA